MATQFQSPDQAAAPPAPRPAFLTTAEVAARLRISLTLAKRMVATGQIPSLKLGARRVVPVAVLERMVAAKVAELDGRDASA